MSRTVYDEPPSQSSTANLRWWPDTYWPSTTLPAQTLNASHTVWPANTLLL